MKPRLGHIQFLNCLPLYYGLVKNDVLLDVDLVKAAPRDLATMLIGGELDVAPIPAIEYGRHADELVLLPDISVSSDGPVLSIMLMSKRPVDELGGSRVALTNTSRTSQVLTQILLANHFKVDPDYIEMPPDLATMMRESDAALLIGDDALRAFYQPTDLLKYDLGTEWKHYTELPMVYAVWAVRREYANRYPEMVARLDWGLNQSKDYSLQHIDAISEYAARWEPFPVAFFRSYYDALRFHFGPRYRDGLARYFREAHDIGALETLPDIEVFSASEVQA